LEAILACLERIEAQLKSDEYEQGPVVTVGGGANLYLARSPYNTECEFMVIAALMAASSGNGSIVISSTNPAITAPGGNFGLASGGMDNNMFDGYILPVSTTQSPVLLEHWQPLGRGANVNVLVSGVSAFAIIAFRRKLDRAIPAPPRRQPHSHSHVQSRRGARTFMAGFENQYPGTNYEHETVPESQDTEEIQQGVAENLSPAQIALAKLRGKAGVY
jgi:hypothetical protein